MQEGITVSTLAAVSNPPGDSELKPTPSGLGLAKSEERSNDQAKATPEERTEPGTDETRNLERETQAARTRGETKI